MANERTLFVALALALTILRGQAAEGIGEASEDVWGGASQNEAASSAASADADRPWAFDWNGSASHLYAPGNNGRTAPGLWPGTIGGGPSGWRPPHPDHDWGGRGGYGPWGPHDRWQGDPGYSRFFPRFRNTPPYGYDPRYGYGPRFGAPGDLGAGTPGALGGGQGAEGNGSGCYGCSWNGDWHNNRVDDRPAPRPPHGVIRNGQWYY